jgi:hypothetical protein
VVVVNVVESRTEDDRERVVGGEPTAISPEVLGRNELGGARGSFCWERVFGSPSRDPELSNAGPGARSMAALFSLGV